MKEELSKHQKTGWRIFWFGVFSFLNCLVFMLVFFAAALLKTDSSAYVMLFYALILAALALHTRSRLQRQLKTLRANDALLKEME
jgi:hypothetical protein